MATKYLIFVSGCWIYIYIYMITLFGTRVPNSYSVPRHIWQPNKLQAVSGLIFFGNAFWLVFLRSSFFFRAAFYVRGQFFLCSFLISVIFSPCSLLMSVILGNFCHVFFRIFFILRSPGIRKWLNKANCASKIWYWKTTFHPVEFVFICHK